MWFCWHDETKTAETKITKLLAQPKSQGQTVSGVNYYALYKVPNL